MVYIRVFYIVIRRFWKWFMILTGLVSLFHVYINFGGLFNTKAIHLEEQQCYCRSLYPWRSLLNLGMVWVEFELLTKILQSSTLATTPQWLLRLIIRPLSNKQVLNKGNSNWGEILIMSLSLQDKGKNIYEMIKTWGNPRLRREKWVELLLTSMLDWSHVAYLTS